jgi:hypothetical protein
MPPPEFEPAISAGDRPQTHALDLSLTGTSSHEESASKFKHLLAYKL